MKTPFLLAAIAALALPAAAANPNHLDDNVFVELLFCVPVLYCIHRCSTPGIVKKTCPAGCLPFYFVLSSRLFRLLV